MGTRLHLWIKSKGPNLRKTWPSVRKMSFKTQLKTLVGLFRYLILKLYLFKYLSVSEREKPLGKHLIHSLWVIGLDVISVSRESSTPEEGILHASKMLSCVFVLKSCGFFVLVILLMKVLKKFWCFCDLNESFKTYSKDLFFLLNFYKN